MLARSVRSWAKIAEDAARDKLRLIAICVYPTLCLARLQESCANWINTTSVRMHGQRLAHSLLWRRDIDPKHIMLWYAIEIPVGKPILLRYLTTAGGNDS